MECPKLYPVYNAEAVNFLTIDKQLEIIEMQVSRKYDKACACFEDTKNLHKALKEFSNSRNQK